MKKTAFNPPENKPKIDINKPEDFKPDGSFWYQPSSALWVYLIFIMASLYFWQGAQEVQRSEIPYSEFLQRVDRGEVVDAIVSNKVITITMADFEAAIDRVIAGPEKKNRGLNAQEKRRVAFHESGHTLVAESVPTGEPVHKVSIIPRGVAALGYTLQLPVEEKFLSTQNELRDQIAILLGGRVAEEIIFGDVSSGASNDLERASEIARNMVTRLGMSEKLGPLTWGVQRELQYLGQSSVERNYSEETAQLIDAEVKRLVEEGRQRATEILVQQRATLDKLAQVLEEKEVLNGEEVEAIIGRIKETVNQSQERTT
ncbi:MAG TPA: hypothetical protein ENJ07_03275 [Gammaproteobacteria bacterium]|nr:hypothetical protein [Gammaproteobacteria bacterium]